MIVTIKKGTEEKELEEVIKVIEQEKGLKAQIIHGEERSIVAVIGIVDLDKERLQNRLTLFDSVERVAIISDPFTLASKECGNGGKITVSRRIGHNTDIGGEKRGLKKVKVTFGGTNTVVIAGPCTVESYEQMDETASFLSGLGVKVLRGGAFKPRTAPRSFEGLGEKGLEILRAVGDKYGMLVASELLAYRQADLFPKYVDIVQIGTRNMHNSDLLKRAGELNMPVILKRGMSATIKEWLCAAEYILDLQEDKEVILCERGIRTFEPATRNTLDINAIPVVQEKSWLPIIIDPSHATGNSKFVPQVTNAAVAAGAGGLLIEVHPDPKNALIDGHQSLNFKAFEEVLKRIQDIAHAVGHKIV